MAHSSLCEGDNNHERALEKKSRGVHHKEYIRVHLPTSATVKNGVPKGNNASTD
jgi:hypothetical protein